MYDYQWHRYEKVSNNINSLLSVATTFTINGIKISYLLKPTDICKFVFCNIKCSGKVFQLLMTKFVIIVWVRYILLIFRSQFLTANIFRVMIFYQIIHVTFIIILAKKFLTCVLTGKKTFKNSFKLHTKIMLISYIYQTIFFFKKT